MLYMESDAIYGIRCYIYAIYGSSHVLDILYPDDLFLLTYVSTHR